ncbi:MAG: Fic family protein [Candidatus Omnitrophica bacterium]|nr:Fic family protein [Candidatus Omnitrophota bacterium]
MARNYIVQLDQILSIGDLTQGELAERLGVTFAALNRWLRGHAKPHPQRIQAIQRLHREVVGYPSVTDEQLARILRRADHFKRKRLWNLIGSHHDLQDELLLEHTYNSTSIEGTTFSKRETEVVIFDKGVIPDKSLVEHLEVTNHAAVLRDIFQKRYRGPITETFIKGLHRDLIRGLREDAGSYSKHRRTIRGVNIALADPRDIPEEMAGLIRAWKKKPVRKTVQEIADFHVHFELIHPFGDGNGRVGRLLMAFQCLEEDYPPVVIENARKAEYYEVLEYAQRKSGRPFVSFLADEMEKTSQILRKYLRR